MQLLETQAAAFPQACTRMPSASGESLCHSMFSWTLAGLCFLIPVMLLGPLISEVRAESPFPAEQMPVSSGTTRNHQLEDLGCPGECW